MLGSSALLLMLPDSAFRDPYQGDHLILVETFFICINRSHYTRHIPLPVSASKPSLSYALFELQVVKFTLNVHVGDGGKGG